MGTRHVIKAGKGAAARPASSPFLETLKVAVLRLRCIQAVATTTAVALRSQNADHDSEFATVLQRAVAEPLLTEIERLEGLLGSRSSVGVTR